MGTNDEIGVNLEPNTEEIESNDNKIVTETESTETQRLLFLKIIIILIKLINIFIYFNINLVIIDISVGSVLRLKRTTKSRLNGCVPVVVEELVFQTFSLFIDNIFINLLVIK
jgi:hypothetical protein